jgi:adenylate cyclase
LQLQSDAVASAERKRTVVFKSLAWMTHALGPGRIVGLVLIVALVLLRIWDPAPVEELRLRTFDLYQLIKPRGSTARPVVIVDIDEDSLHKIGQWPWPRTVVADLVRRLASLGALGIGFDVIFAEPDRYSPESMADLLGTLDPATRARIRALPSNDQVLADAFRDAPVVVGESGLPFRGASGLPPQIGIASMGADPAPFLINFPGLLRDIPILEKSAHGIGMLTIKPERDGIVRRVPLAVRANGRIMPALSLELLHVAAGSGPVIIRADAAGIQSIGIRELEIPTDRNGQIWVHFGRSDSNRYVSAAAVLAGQIPRDRIDHKLVLIGTSATGLLDRTTTPVDPIMPGVEVHAQILENALTSGGISYPDYAMPAELLAAILVSLLIIAIAPALRALSVAALGLLMAAGLVATSWYFYTQQALLFDFTFPLLSLLAVFFVVVFGNYLREQFQRQQIRSAFGQYLAPDLVAQLVKTPQKLVLGGEERTMTFLFSDVRGFTALSEMYKHQPQRLTSLMNRLLTALTEAIIFHHGTIDKYMGDAVMAFWNAPLDDADHAANACQAALAMVERLNALNVEREAEAKLQGEPYVPMKAGIGVNSGACIVGNMGSTLRFNYSVLGDAVNLASRIEGQTKSYGVSIAVGATTMAAAADKFAFLELDLIRVKGKSEPEILYGVFGGAELAASQHFGQLRELNHQMLTSYRRQDWGKALEAIALSRGFAEEFGLSDFLNLYAARINAFSKHAPAADWDGVFTAESK